MIKSAIKRRLRLIIKKVISNPRLKQLGHRVLAPFPGVKGWIIRLIQAGKFNDFAANNRIEGYGERQQRLTNGLEQRRKHYLNEQ